MASEEIKDPHNLFVKALTELGIFGAVLCMGWMLLLMWELTRPVTPATHATAPSGRQSSPLRQYALIAALAMGLNLLGAVDFTRDPGYVAVECLKRLLYFGVILLALAVGTVRSSTDARPDDRPATLLLVGMIVAIAMFLVHNLIDFSLWETGPLTLFAVLSGALIGIRGPSMAGRRKWNRSAVAGFACVLTAWLVAAVGFVIPLTDAERRAQRGDEMIRTANQTPSNLRRAGSEYRAAVETSPLRNPDYLWRVARAGMFAQDPPTQVDVWLSQAIAANPLDGVLRIARANFWLSQAEATQPREQIRGDFFKAIALNPNDVRLRLSFADVLTRWGDATSALDQYRAALSINDRMHPDDPERLSPQEVESIRRDHIR
jgi:hypothetical protein